MIGVPNIFLKMLKTRFTFNINILCVYVSLPYQYFFIVIAL